MKERLAELKKRRKALGLRQEDMAALIGKERATYTRKEKGEFPITIEEWDTFERKLSEMEIEKSRAKGVMPGEFPDNAELQKLVNLFKNEDPDVVRAVQRGVEFVINVAERELMLREILETVRALKAKGPQYDQRLDALEAKVDHLIKSEGEDAKAVVHRK